MEVFRIFLLSSPRLWAATAASYCPSRPGELIKKNPKTSLHDGMGNSVVCGVYYDMRPHNICHE